MPFLTVLLLTHTAPGRVVDLQVESTGINELTLSWKPPKHTSSGYTVPVNTYIVERVMGTGQYRYVVLPRYNIAYITVKKMGHYYNTTLCHYWDMSVNSQYTAQ